VGSAADWYTRVVHMALAMARPWKHPKTGIYWLRKRVPDELRARLGKGEEKFTLRTRDPPRPSGGTRPPSQRRTALGQFRAPVG